MSFFSESVFILNANDLVNSFFLSYVLTKILVGFHELQGSISLVIHGILQIYLLELTIKIKNLKSHLVLE